MPRGTIPACGEAMSKYTMYGCRCDVCRKMYSDYQKRTRAAARQRVAADPSQIPHGTRTGYAFYACRCDACRTANTTYQRGLRERKMAELRAARSE